MLPPSKVVRSTLLLSMGQVLCYGLSFARNVILARVLSKADFGLAALFGMTVILLEIAGRMSIGQQIIQSKQGDSKAFLATSQAFQAALAVLGASLILVLSHPVALLMHVPKISWAFATLAVVPFARAFENLDYFRQQRDLNYLPAVLCDVIPQVSVTIAAWPLAVWIGDFRVIICLMIAKASLGMIMTHLLSRQPYRWAWHSDYVKSMFSFGLPLFFNGILIFASQQADQIVVGAFLSLEKLAYYALAFSLVSVPGAIFAQVGSSLMLPIFARVQDNSAQFRMQYRTCAQYAGIGALLLLLPLVVAGGQFAIVIYGAKYTGIGPLIAILGTAAAVRFIRIVPAIASMATADTMNQLYSNVFRGLSLPLALTAAYLGGGATLIASCALAAELSAAVVSILRLRRRQHIPLSDTLPVAVYILGFLAGGMVLTYLGSHSWGRPAAAATVLAALALVVAVARLAFPTSTRMLIMALRKKSTPAGAHIVRQK